MRRNAKTTGDNEEFNDEDGEGLEPARKKKKKEIYGLLSE